MDLNDLIKYFEVKLESYPNLTPISRKVTDAVIWELKGKKSLLNLLSGGLLPKQTEQPEQPKMKMCYRYGQMMVEQCEVCESCLKAEDLQWNEGIE